MICQDYNRKRGKNKVVSLGTADLNRVEMITSAAYLDR
jgi:hypothetical protein